MHYNARTAQSAKQTGSIHWLQAAAIICRDSANRWLDNVYSLKQWCKKKFSGRDADIDKFFEENGLTSKVDYID